MSRLTSQSSRKFVYVTILVAAAAIGIREFHTRAVLADQIQLQMVADSYAAGSLEQHMAILRELQRQRNPEWKDLSGVQTAARVVSLAVGLFSPRVTPLTQTSANFVGNKTTISGAPDSIFNAIRLSDCSITKDSGTYSFVQTNPGFTVVNRLPKFERAVHTLAGLTTTPGVFAGGCASPSIGMSSRRRLFTGSVPGGLFVIAWAGYNVTANTNVLYTGTMDSSFNYHSFNIDYSNPNVNSLATGDFNNDGIADLVEVNELASTASVSIAFGKADGTFATPTLYPVSLDRAVAAVVQDFNGDGILDIAVASTSLSAPFGQNISILTGKGDGTFNSAVSFAVPDAISTTGGKAQIINLIAADLRGTGKKDIITSNGLVLLNNGNATFVVKSGVFPATVASSNYGPNLAAGDLNKDGIVDLVVCDGNRIAIYVGNGDGTFKAAGGYATIDNVGYVNITDIDGDGNPDIFVGFGNGGVFFGDQFDINNTYALMGNGDATFRGAPTLPFSYNGSNLADVNGDSKPDVVQLSGTTFTTYLGKGDASFSAGPSLSTGSFTYGGRTITYTSISSYVVGDLNGDGKADLLWVPTETASSFAGNVFYLIALGQSDGSFAAPTVYTFPPIAATPKFDVNMAVSDLHLVDTNGDGKPDLLYTFTDDIAQGGPILPIHVRGFGVVLGNGNATFKSTGVTSLTYSSTTIPGVLDDVPLISTIADLNVDRKLDIIATNRTGSAGTGFGSEARLYLGNGDGSFGTGTIVPTAANPGKHISQASGPSVLVADLNGDGFPDIVSIGETTAGDAQLGVSLGRSGGTFGPVAITPLNGGDIILSSGFAIGDIDGDGKLDIVITAFLSSLSGIFPGNGDGTFQSVVDSGFSSPVFNFNLNAFGFTTIADFNGDGKKDVLVGNTILPNLGGVVVTTVASSTSLVAAPSTATAGQTVTLTATVTGSGSTPAGTVTFSDSLNGGATTSLGAGSLNSSGVATLATNTLAVGTHSLTAGYGGSTAFNASASTAVTVVVASAPPITTTTTLTASPTSINFGQNVGLTATVTAASGVAGGSVTFLDSLGGAAAVTVGTTTLNASGLATTSTTALAIGTHAITSVYAGNTSFGTSTSAAVSITVSAVAVADFSVALSPSSGSVQPGMTAATVVTIAPVNGFSQSVSFACAGLPSTVTCTFSPTSVAPAGASASTTLTFTRLATASAVAKSHPWTLAFVFFGFVGMVRSRRRLPWLACLLLLGAGCSNNNSSATAPVTSTVSVIATSGALTHSVSYTLTSR